MAGAGAYVDTVCFRSSDRRVVDRCDSFFEQIAFLDDMDPLSGELEMDMELPDPWNNSHVEDFILITEFCEKIGPKPVKRIPAEDCNNIATVDVNTIALQLMSSDYQRTDVKLSGETKKSRFVIASDTQVLISLTGLQHKLYAFAYHFILYDRYARGFVRPFCICYLSTDRCKLYDNFQQLLHTLDAIISYLKCSNRMLFQQDLYDLSTDIAYTQKEFEAMEQHNKKIEFDTGNDFVVLPHQFDGITNESLIQWNRDVNYTLAAVRASLSITSLASIRNQLHAIESCYTQRCCCLHSHIENSLILPDNYSVGGVVNRVGAMSLIHPNAYFDRARLSRSTPKRPWDDNVIGVKSKCALCSSIKRKKRANSVSGDIISGHVLVGERRHTPKLVDSSGRRRFDIYLRDICELCPWGGKIAFSKLMKLHNQYSRDSIVISMEEQECSLLKYSAGLLTIGKCITTNFFTEKCEMKLRQQQQVDTDIIGQIEVISDGYLLNNADADIDEYNNEPILILASNDVTLERENEVDNSDSDIDDNSFSTSYSSNINWYSTSLANRYLNTMDGIPTSQGYEAFHYTENVFDDDQSGSYTSTSINSVSDTVSSYRTALDYSRQGSRCSMESLESFQSLRSCPFSSSIYSSQQYFFPSPKSINLASYTHFIFNGVPDKAEKSYYSTPQPSSPPLCPDALECPLKDACTGSDSVVTATGAYKLPGKYGNINKRYPGMGIWYYMHVKKFYNIIHVVYSLMIGRPVIVVGKTEDRPKVKRMIIALALFVPGHLKEGIEFWRTGSLDDSDIAKLTLVGAPLCRNDACVYAIVQDRVTVMDVSGEHLKSITYSGRLLEHMLMAKHLKSEEAFVAHIHSTLCEIGRIAFLYYHLFYMRQKINCKYQENAFFKNQKLDKSNDTNIIKYFVELIVQQEHIYTHPSEPIRWSICKLKSRNDVQDFSFIGK